jgi:hypothetical protein
LSLSVNFIFPIFTHTFSFVLGRSSLFVPTVEVMDGFEEVVDAGFEEVIEVFEEER